MTTLVTVNFAFPMSSEVTIVYSNLIINLYVQFWGRGEKIHPNGCRAYSTLRKWKKKSQWLYLCSMSSLQKILQRHSLHFGVGDGSWLGVYLGQQSYLLPFCIVFVQVKHFGKYFLYWTILVRITAIFHELN